MFVAALALVLPVPARAHDFTFTEVRLVLARDATFRVDVRCDLDALALGVDSGADRRRSPPTSGGCPRRSVRRSWPDSSSS